MSTLLPCHLIPRSLSPVHCVRTIPRYPNSLGPSHRVTRPFQRDLSTETALRSSLVPSPSQSTGSGLIHPDIGSQSGKRRHCSETKGTLASVNFILGVRLFTNAVPSVLFSTAWTVLESIFVLSTATQVMNGLPRNVYIRPSTLGAPWSLPSPP